LLTFEEAKRAIESGFKPQPSDIEDVILLEAYNRVLGIDVVSPIDIPGFTTSTIQGYALCSVNTVTATEDNPVVCRVEGMVSAGEQPRFVLSGNKVAEVSAGAILPLGADAVIAARDGVCEDDVLRVYGAVSRGENVHTQGSDIHRGSIVFRKGQVLGSAEIGVLAALGYTDIGVIRFPMVAVFSVGTEFGELGKPLLPGKAFDAAAYSLCTAVIECGAKPVGLGVVAPDKEVIRQTFLSAVASADMVIVCSSVDIVEVVDVLGESGVVVSGVAVKPGKQTGVTFIGGKPVFIMPSNPLVALLMFQLFARSLVQRLGGRPISGLKTVTAYAGSRMFSAKGSRTYVFVQLSFDERCRLIAEPLGVGGDVLTLSIAKGVVEIPENEQYIDVGREVLVMLFCGSAGRG
jgi:molybdopterin biosynthesis enzyme